MAEHLLSTKAGTLDLGRARFWIVVAEHFDAVSLDVLACKGSVRLPLGTQVVLGFADRVGCHALAT